MNRLVAHQKDLYELRFSPMCKPAGEVAYLTQLESHTTRARMMMLWRIAAGHLNWGPRESELLYQSTLDSISEAFDVFHYPVSQIMLDARADVWEAGLAPKPVQQAVEFAAGLGGKAPPQPFEEAILLGGELVQLPEPAHYQAVLDAVGAPAASWLVPTGALAYALGAREIAHAQAKAVLAGIAASGARRVIADGPETAWALLKIYPDLGLDLPEGVQVRLLSQVLAESSPAHPVGLGLVCVHDSRPACLIADQMSSHLAVMPGYFEDEAEFGVGGVYEAPRQIVERLGGRRVFGTWTRALAKSCGADDGLWLTYPDLARGLAGQRLEYARQLQAGAIITDSPLCAAWLGQSPDRANIAVRWLPELLAEPEEAKA